MSAASEELEKAARAIVGLNIIFPHPDGSARSLDILQPLRQALEHLDEERQRA